MGHIPKVNLQVIGYIFSRNSIYLAIWFLGQPSKAYLEFLNVCGHLYINYSHYILQQNANNILWLCSLGLQQEGQRIKNRQYILRVPVHMTSHTHTHTHNTQSLNIRDTDFSSSKPLKIVPVQDLAKQRLVGDWETSVLRSSGRRERRGGQNDQFHDCPLASPIFLGRMIHHHREYCCFSPQKILHRAPG